MMQSKSDVVVQIAGANVAQRFKQLGISDAEEGV